jgi:DNA-binding response OmpR family regulator
MEKIEILLVEDNAGDAVLIRQILAEAAVPVNLHIVRDGEQALTLLSDAQFRPALIILDLNIPRISGMALLHQWKTVRTPIVVFSSSLNDAERSRALELGAREFIPKPTDIEAFTTAVCGIVERYAERSHETASGA